MRTNIIRFTSVLAIFIGCIFLFACSKEEMPSKDKPSQTTIFVSSVSLNKSSILLLVGDSETLTATVSPANATNSTVTWSSSDTSVATVSAGKITAIKAGTATITAKAGEKTATCTVTVNEKKKDVESVALDKTSGSIKVGETLALNATVSPSDAENKDITWSSSDETVATVKDGVVTAIKVGTATITAKAGEKTATCTITVVATPVESITLNKKTASLKAGETTTLTATVTPSGATDKTIKWSSSDQTVATVKDGVVTAIKVGTATITAKAGDKTATCTVTVTPSINGSHEGITIED